MRSEKETEKLNKQFNKILQELSDDYYGAIFKFCFLTNTFYNSEKINDLLDHYEEETDINNFLNDYLDYIDALKEEKKETGEEVTFFSQIKQENFDKIYKDDLIQFQLSEEDKKCRLNVIEICGADPFYDDAPEDRAQLYRSAATILTDSMRKDLPKQKAALSIVRGYSNIEKYQQNINDIMKSGKIDDSTQKTLDSYIKVQKTIQDSINTTAEKNNFTVKGIGNDGKGMLSDVMQQIEDKGIDKGVTNFYDIQTSKSIQEIANISFKAQLNQVNLSKTDYADILQSQAKIVKESQEIARQSVEALRLAKEKIVKQKLLDELEKDYKKKGISPEEIEEFINREYALYDINKK